jgi:hypothetical protein
MAIPPEILEESTRNKNHQESTLQWTLADGKFLVIPPEFLVFLPGMVGFLEDSSRNCKDLGFMWSGINLAGERCYQGYILIL